VSRSPFAQAAVAELAEHVVTRDDLVDFVRALRDDWERSRESWSNDGPEDALAIVEAWLERIDLYLALNGRRPPDAPSWGWLSQVLLGARKGPHGLTHISRSRSDT
jgi:hypothetical protein